MEVLLLHQARPLIFDVPAKEPRLLHLILLKANYYPLPNMPPLPTTIRIAQTLGITTSAFVAGKHLTPFNMNDTHSA